MSYSLSPNVKARFFITGTNRPLAGGLLYTYLVGTTTPAATYSDNLGTPNTNPIVLNADGECDLYLDDSVNYRMILKNSAGVTQFDEDRVSSINSAQLAALDATAALTAADRVQTGLDRIQTGLDTIATQAAQAAAEAARDAINTTGKVYTAVEGTASGIAGTTNGQQFAVIAADLLSYSIWRNNAGVALQLSSVYTKAYLDSLFQSNGRPDVGLVIKDVNGRSPAFFDVFGKLVGTFVGNLTGNATGIDATDWTISTTDRPDVALAIIDLSGRGIVIVDKVGQLPAASGGGTVVIPHPTHTDTVLSDFISAGAVYCGDFVLGTTYRSQSIVRVGSRYWFYFATSTGAVLPALDTLSADELPIFDSECYIVDDDFTTNTGAAHNRYTPAGYRWNVTGTGYLSATVASGYMTAAQNTYFELLDLASPITEFGTTVLYTQQPITHTMSISPNNLGPGVFNEMWHTNFYGDTGSGSVGVTYWHDGVLGGVPIYKYIYSVSFPFTINVEHDYVIKLRGKFAFGYFDGVLVFIHLADLIETLTATANSVYVQNHFATAGIEQHHRVWIKVAEGAKYKRIATDSENSTAPLLLTTDSSPEGSVTAPRGSKVFSSNGTEYRKSTNTNNTGWI